MPELLRRVGFDADGGKVIVGAGTTVYSGAETRKWLAWRAKGHLQQGDEFRQSWLDAGITEEVIQETLVAVEKWANFQQVDIPSKHVSTHSIQQLQAGLLKVHPCNSTVAHS
jgi:carbonic anhydrase/acetyltransferase-like protein (isoleucine patch superfamily)